MATVERDINDIFDDIVLTEERICKQGYDEGYKVGRVQAELEGYKLGYSQGQELGKELGEIYGAVLAHLQFAHTERIHKTLIQLKQAIDIFPRFNDPNYDIIGALEYIRSLDKRLKAILHIGQLPAENSPTTTKTPSRTSKDYTF